MTRSVSSRRRFLQGSAGLLAGSALTPYIFTANAEEAAKPPTNFIYRNPRNAAEVLKAKEETLLPAE